MRLSPLALLAFYGISRACTCAVPPPVAEQRERKPITVHARVLANEIRGDSGSEFREVTVRLLKDYSPHPRDLPDTLFFLTAIQGSLCGINPAVGAEEILFGDTFVSLAERRGRPSNSTYNTNICAGNVSGPALAGALAELEAAAPIRVPSPPGRRARDRKRIRPGSGFLFRGRYGPDGRRGAESAQTHR